MTNLEKLQEYVTKKKAKKLVGVSLTTQMYQKIKKEAVKKEETIQATIRRKLASATLNNKINEKSEIKNEIILKKIEELLTPKNK